LYIVNADTVPRTDLMPLERHLSGRDLDDVGFKQRRDDVGKDKMVGREQASVTDRTFERAALYPILNDQVAREAG
jgi:hypothetical protein